MQQRANDRLLLCQQRAGMLLRNQQVPGGIKRTIKEPDVHSALQRPDSGPVDGKPATAALYER